MKNLFNQKKSLPFLIITLLASVGIVRWMFKSPGTFFTIVVILSFIYIFFLLNKKSINFEPFYKRHLKEKKLKNKNKKKYPLNTYDKRRENFKVIIGGKKKKK